MPKPSPEVCLAVDVGGTFTDVALEINDRQFTTKVLTTPDAPEDGVMSGIERALAQAGIIAGDIGLLVHGTTLATNALIERKGAKTALITTEGLRDSVEMAQENRFEQYDINIDRPEPLVPRYLRWPVTERMNAAGKALLPLDEDSVRALLPLIDEYEIETIAVGLIHAYANPDHEQRVGEILTAAHPDLSLTLSSQVCPEIREYERQSTASANAYIQPRMSRYLIRFDSELRTRGFVCPFLLMTSGGGLMSLETAVRFPIRLVESGPAGGAILAAEIARQCGIENVVSFDMGGTTAKICLIDGHQPQMTRTFEVARAYRNLKGSGLPVRIPAIEMVEIGAGGGSIAAVDGMKRITVGPESAGASPGPACYGQGGTNPTVTDADVVLGRMTPDGFAGGSVTLKPDHARSALDAAIGAPLALDGPLSAFAVSEIVDENMANAARVHAIEWGKDISARAMIAFGGAAPLHAARLAEKLDIDTVIVPAGAGVGSAIGFLRAPVSYEVVRSRYMNLAEFDAPAINELVAEMAAEAHAIVSAGAGPGPFEEIRLAYMRYHGQGHEIVVALPIRDLTADDANTLQASFEEEYRRLYGRAVPGQQPEILSWTLSMTAAKPAVAAKSASPAERGSAPDGNRAMFDPGMSGYVDATVCSRGTLIEEAPVIGPAAIVEDQTTTIVPTGFTACVNAAGHIVLVRQL